MRCPSFSLHVPATKHFAENGVFITVTENEDICLECALGSVHFPKCNIDIWYKIGCADTSETDEQRVFVRNKQLENPVVLNKLDFSFDKRNDVLHIPNATNIHSGLYLRNNACSKEHVFVYISYIGMLF